MSSEVPRAPKTCRGKGRGRRRSSHFTDSRKLRAQRERRQSKTLCEIVDVDGRSDERRGLKVRSLNALAQVSDLLNVMIFFKSFMYL